jgi:H+/Cl- antiporter ClcA
MAVARWFLIVGGILVIVGLVLHFAPWLLTWFGRLPGDIRYETGRSRVFIPVTSMIIVSIVLTLAVNLFFRR